MKLLWAKFEGTHPSYMCAKKIIVGVVVYKKMFEAKVEHN
jgi:hypothetical protein